MGCILNVKTVFQMDLKQENEVTFIKSSFRLLCDKYIVEHRWKFRVSLDTAAVD